MESSAVVAEVLKEGECRHVVVKGDWMAESFVPCIVDDGADERLRSHFSGLKYVVVGDQDVVGCFHVVTYDRRCVVINGQVVRGRGCGDDESGGPRGDVGCDRLDEAD